MLTFMDLDEAFVGKYEMKQDVAHDFKCPGGLEESKTARLEEDSSVRATPASGGSGAQRRQGDKQNLSFQISDSADTLADNPLCTLIKQF
jgi:hypothetical protein